MDKRTLIDKIKDQLKSLLQPEQEVKLAQVKAGDLMISSPDEELTIGSEVMILDEKGIGNPLADGKYILDSGLEIQVESGKVKEMMKSDDEEKEDKEMKKEDKEMKKEKEEMGYDGDKEMNINLEDKVAKLEEKMMALMEKMNMMLGDAEMMKKEMSALANSPSTEPITTKSVEFRSVETKKSTLDMPDIMSIRERARKSNR